MLVWRRWSSRHWLLSHRFSYMTYSSAAKVRVKCYICVKALLDEAYR